MSFATLIPQCTMRPGRDSVGCRPMSVQRRPSFASGRCRPAEHGESSWSFVGAAHPSPRAARVQAAASSGVASTVKIIIQGRHMDVTPAIKEYVQEKVGRAVTPFASVIKEIDVNLSVRGGDSGTKGQRQQKVELTVYTLRTGVIRSEDVEDTLYAAIDLVCDKVQRKLRKTKEKAISRGRWAGSGGGKGQHRLVAEVLNSAPTITSYDTPAAKEVKLPPQILRTKYFYLQPMSVEEALEQLEAVGHDFFIFRDALTNTIQVVYRRKSTGYGVIVPMDEAAEQHVVPGDSSIVPGD